MARKINIKKSKLFIERAKKLTDSRNWEIGDKEFQNIIFNYWKTTTFPTKLYHHVIMGNTTKEIKQQSLANYIVNLVSIWETYLRDLFTVALRLDRDFFEFAKSKFLEADLSEHSLEDQVNLLSVAPNFQNITEINQIFSKLFESKDFFELVSNFNFKAFRGRIVFEKFSIYLFVKNSKKLIDLVFNERHKIIHDANYSIKTYPSKVIKELEFLFITFPQVLCVIFSEKFDLKKIIFDEKEKVIYLGDGDISYISDIEETISDDWEVVKDT